jgi:gamma-glutamylcyclotransferase (GGCT)/AIG2-like uncharacterized protein YtfP
LHFFFYGTLLDGSDNAVAREVHRLLGAVGPASVSGTIFAVPDPAGWYPALMAGEGTVQGRLFAAHEGFSPADLARLDAYEDYDQQAPERSLYVRETVEAVLAGGARTMALAYRFNQPLPAGSRPVPGGDFRAWLAEQGLSAFTGLRKA